MPDEPARPPLRRGMDFTRILSFHDWLDRWNDPAVSESEAYGLLRQVFKGGRHEDSRAVRFLLDLALDEAHGIHDDQTCSTCSLCVTAVRSLLARVQEDTDPFEENAHPWKTFFAERPDLARGMVHVFYRHHNVIERLGYKATQDEFVSELILSIQPGRRGGRVGLTELAIQELPTLLSILGAKVDVHVVAEVPRVREVFRTLAFAPDFQGRVPRTLEEASVYGRYTRIARVLLDLEIAERVKALPPRDSPPPASPH